MVVPVPITSYQIPGAVTLVPQGALLEEEREKGMQGPEYYAGFARRAQELLKSALL